MIYHSSEISDVLKELNVDSEKGLPTGVADERFLKYGKNLITNNEKAPIFKAISKEFKSYINIILIVSSILSIIVNLIYKTEIISSPVLILVLLAFNILINVYYKKHSEKAADDLASMNIPTVKVLRDKIVKNISSQFVVPGDILILETGDYISADARLIEAVDFRCNEVFITGEEIPTEKNAFAVIDHISPVEKRVNMVFSGSSVITGHAKAVVTETGMNTESGKAASLLEANSTANLKLKNKLSSIEKTSSIIIFLLAVFTFFANLFLNFKTQVSFALLISDSFISASVLLVSLLSFGLTVLVAVSLGIAVRALMKKGVIAKNFSVFDILPQVSVICSDKTGTLTKDNMVVEKIYNGNSIIDAKNASNDHNSVTILRLAALCTSQSKSDIDNPMYNDSTELAIIKAYENSVITDEHDIYNDYPLLCKIPFDFERKVTITVNMIDGVPVAIAKGAPDYLLRISNNKSEEIKNIAEDFAAQGMRVIAVAYKKLSEIPSNPEFSQLEKDMTFTGLIALSDTPQEDSISLVEECDIGNIRTIMITGDHILTAKAVAKRLGILKDSKAILSGEELAKLSDEELLLNIDNYSVFARLLPDQKLRIVNALKTKGYTVALTGDSINDAQALKTADVGIAMGTRGTDVARGAADIIMNRNQFSAIIDAIDISRGMFLSIRKALTYLLSSNIVKIFSFIICLLIYGSFPLTALQFFMVCILTDVFPVLSIISDGIHETKHTQKYTPSQKTLFTCKSVILLIVQSVIGTIMAIIAYGSYIELGKNLATTIMFALLVFSQLFNMATLKFEDFFFKFRHFKSFAITAILFIFIIITLLLILNDFGLNFGFIVLEFLDIIKILLLSIMSFISGEVVKIGFYLYQKFNK